MRKLIFSMFVLLMLFTGISCSDKAAVEFTEECVPTKTNLTVQAENYIFPTTSIPTKAMSNSETIDQPLPIEIEPVVPSISDEDVELLALLTMAEAEGESEYGQRLVIDTVLNRVDDPHFPDSIRDVIWQKNQFSPMWNGRIEKCYVKDELVRLVCEELENRTNYDVVFFRTEKYHTYGVPMFQVGAHYFSSYD